VEELWDAVRLEVDARLRGVHREEVLLALNGLVAEDVLSLVPAGEEEEKKEKEKKALGVGLEVGWSILSWIPEGDCILYVPTPLSLYHPLHSPLTLLSHSLSRALLSLPFSPHPAPLTHTCLSRPCAGAAGAVRGALRAISSVHPPAYRFRFPLSAPCIALLLSLSVSPAPHTPAC
jgi:hypothetical protein